MSISTFVREYPGATFALLGVSAALITGIMLGLGHEIDPRVAETHAETDRIREFNGMPPLTR